MTQPTVWQRWGWPGLRRPGAFLTAGALCGLGFVGRPPTPAFAAPGELDPGFGVGGLAVVGPVPSLRLAGRAVRVQKDGKIVVAAEHTTGGNADFSVWRFNPDGRPDTTFDTDGLAILALPGIQEAEALALQQDGKIILAGHTGQGVGDEFMLARFNTDGTLDPTFGAGGYTTLDFGPERDAGADAVAVQGDGKIVAAGTTILVGPGLRDFALARVLPDGAPDPSFTGPGMPAGRLLTDFGPGREDSAFAVTIQADGRILAAGSSYDDATSYDYALARYLPNGRLDHSFDRDGQVLTGLPGSGEFVRAIALQRDGKIVAAGIADLGGDNQFAVARFRPNGSLDRSFGIPGSLLPRGWVITHFGHVSTDDLHGLALQKDGKTVVAGSTGTGTEINFALARYRKNGRPDLTFGRALGTPGRVTTDVGDDDEALGIALQKDGKIVVAGFSGELLPSLVVARYRGR